MIYRLHWDKIDELGDQAFVHYFREPMHPSIAIVTNVGFDQSTCFFYLSRVEHLVQEALINLVKHRPSICLIQHSQCIFVSLAHVEILYHVLIGRHIDSNESVWAKQVESVIL